MMQGLPVAAARWCSPPRPSWLRAAISRSQAEAVSSLGARLIAALASILIPVERRGTRLAPAASERGLLTTCVDRPCALPRTPWATVASRVVLFCKLEPLAKAWLVRCIIRFGEKRKCKPENRRRASPKSVLYYYVELKL